MNDTSITLSEACQEDVALVVGGLVELAVERQRRDHHRQQPRGNDAQGSADEGEHQRLDKELHQDVTAARADGLQQADLFGALGHADQHDVHHADSADAEGERADDAEQRVEADGEGPQHLAALDGVPLGRGLVVLGIEVMAPADHVARSQQSLRCAARRRSAGRRSSAGLWRWSAR